MKPIPFLYEPKIGWIADVEVSLPISALKSAAAYCLKINHDRWLRMPHGEKREHIGRALVDLREFIQGTGTRVQQRIAKKYGDIPLFQSNQRTRPDRAIIDLGGL